MCGKPPLDPNLDAIGENLVGIPSTSESAKEQDAIREGNYEDEIAISEAHYRVMREQYAHRCFFFMCIWAIIVFVLVTLSSISCVPVTISDSVLITLLTGSTVNVIGLVVIILRGIFPKS